MFVLLYNHLVLNLSPFILFCFFQFQERERKRERTLISSYIKGVSKNSSKILNVLSLCLSLWRMMILKCPGKLDGTEMYLHIFPKTLKMVFTAPQPVLVIMSLRKGNALAIKRRSSYHIQWTSRKWCYNSKSWLSDKIKRGISVQSLKYQR